MTSKENLKAAIGIFLSTSQSKSLTDKAHTILNIAIPELLTTGMIKYGKNGDMGYKVTAKGREFLYGFAYIMERKPPSVKVKVHARPMFSVQNSKGEINTYECVEVKQGDVIHAFLPPDQSGASLTLVTSAGPSAIYKVFDWEWRVLQLADE